MERSLKAQATLILELKTEINQGNLREERMARQLDALRGRVESLSCQIRQVSLFGSNRYICSLIVQCADQK